MEKTERIEDFYLKKLNAVPENLKKEIGHFNIFRNHDFVGPDAREVPYNRKEYYKIALIIGRNRFSYADKIIEVNDAALLFANPLVPYKWEPLEMQQDGCFCVFTDAFFSNFGNIKDYPVFQLGADPVYPLNQAELEELRSVFENIFTEINSGYAYKYDLIRTLVLQLVHKAIKMKPAEATSAQDSNANARISSLFSDLLERQFPIESSENRMQLRNPADFATHLSIHTNHLNRALKSVTGKTTSEFIAERIMQEAMILLKYTDWNISEIGYCLGFEEPSHFISFFKKTVNQTPGIFRKTAVA
ncbi:helix-turn-helix transcriptional regulator [Dyadobacter flavalbus]|uniref:Helix-turn-helix transcriptional regulator n=1 Tax=Dyadobacter flavalbus TaxID=2579942 RepID=A0A5M8QPT0_9BACT|nr:AraC family transcriptional regulator [Dyadobacter flavalbus]KAA6438227.1 helix-turn-helix transcriptional regulator [Dyadobacter flavalbus]